MKKLTFKPAWWLSNPHLQTIWPTFCRKPITSLHLVHERFDLPDGDFIDLHWAGEGHKPIVIILHGLEGSIESPYAKGIIHALLPLGVRCVFMHFRGCSGVPNRLSRGYHSGDTFDLACVVKEIQNRYSTVPIGAVGFSLGGNVLLKWLGETAEDNPLTAAVAISVPFELQKTSRRIQKGFSQFYQSHFLKCLRNRLEYKFAIYPPTILLPSFNNLRTLEEFDDQITAPLHGFSGAEEYYRLSSCRQYLKSIKKPTLILHSKDDPFVCESAIPSDEELSSAVNLELTQAGGHVGFISGNTPGCAEYWLEKRVPIFFNDLLQIKGG